MLALLSETMPEMTENETPMKKQHRKKNRETHNAGGVPQCSSVTTMDIILNSAALEPGTQETAPPLLKPQELLNSHFLFDQH
ncbi:basic helix-loop-helix domain-containing protein USF3 isoform X3 [Chelonoidis abingdonii]|uniref:basic helix-loop-helix domain-containing protein USF3 isoform X3 n=1 Tax=Chelonoidis abingdonii TaxID=106734 RepID=UPI003F49A085